MRKSSFNPDAPAYIPGGLVFGRDGPSGILPGRGKTAVPTAKVPNYVKRLGQGVRDNKPGLLPTPNIPPMRANIAAMGLTTPVGAGGMYSRSCVIAAEDPYATPYAQKLSHSMSMDSYGSTHSGFGEDSFPPGFESMSGLFSATPPGFENVAPKNQTNSNGDTLESLLTLLSQQLDGTSKLPLNSSGITTGVPSVSGTAGPSTPRIGCKNIAGVEPDALEALWDPSRLETFDSEQSLFASIAGFYLPSTGTN